MSNVRIFSGSANPKLAQEVAAYLKTTLCPATLGKFSDGESQVRIEENVRGKDIFIIQPTSSPTNDNLMELMFMIDAAKRASAKSITAVVPYYGYGRQDKKKDREPISAKVVADMLTNAGASHIIGMDFHSDQLQGFFNIPADNIPAVALTAGYIKNKNLNKEDVVIVSPDAGGGKRVQKFAEHLGVDYIVMDKDRKKANEVKEIKLNNDPSRVRGKICILYDDMIDTAGTICEAARVLKLPENGAKEVIVLATHGVLSGKALKRLEDSPLDEIVLTNTIALPPGAETLDKISQITIAPLLGEAIGRSVTGESLSALSNVSAQ
ncbi:MAG: ribose-phosphate pyrophosphokinase [Cyanobacteria bacterium]|nr:ribose-phosphate pyrophosphokinase [Cyanobacteriota bacterium]